MSVFENDFRMNERNPAHKHYKTYEPFPDALLDLRRKYDIKIIEQVVSPSSYTDYSLGYGT